MPQHETFCGQLDSVGDVIVLADVVTAAQAIFAAGEVLAYPRIGAAERQCLETDVGRSEAMRIRGIRLPETQTFPCSRRTIKAPLAGDRRGADRTASVGSRAVLFARAYEPTLVQEWRLLSNTQFRRP
jgi:hypothetical protein